MLHVFHVDGGRTLHLDVGLVTGAVSGLQAALADVALVPTPNQVLLISGGTVLEPSKPLSGYAGAGTESNPIYLTSRVVNLEPGALPFHGDEAAEVASTHKDLIAQVESIGGPANFESVKRCSGVAKSCAQNAERAYEVCKKLVEDQHLLHQGWNTLVANLEDVVRSCERKMRKLSMTLEKFLATKDQAAQLLTVFAQDLEVLAKIPLPPALLSEDVRSQLSLAASTAGGGVTPTTLLEWINLADSRHSLEDLEKEAKAQLDQMSRLEMSGLEAQWEQAKTAASQEDMVAIKGIGKRLGQLDEYLRKAETVVAEQRKWAEVVAAMESKALPKPDPALLADIRQTQEESLKGLLGQQSQLVEIAIKFRDSKAELLDNVRRRIGTWIQETHGQLYELATRQMRHTAKLGHLRRRLELLRQIHESPPLFASSVAEVLRRRSFSTEFLGWANALATKALELRNHEEEMRAGFGRKLQRHFLKSLFPALANADTVPEFATLAPQPFDLGLPPLQADDLHHLRASATSLKPFLLVSRASVYEKLSVDNPFQQQSGLRREPSFLGTPPKMIYSGKSFPSTTWLSGEENLDLSPSALLAASTVTPPTRPEFASLASSLPKSPLTADAPPKRPHSTSPNPSEDGGKRSAPIRIPSRPSSMNTSRQASESQFATPDQDFHPASSGDMGSLPEMISKAELIGSLAKDLGKVESPHVMRPVSLSASTPSPMTQRKGAGLDEEDPLAGTGDLLLQASTGTAQTQTSTEFTHPSVLSEKEETIAKLAREEKILNRRITDLESAVMSQSHFVVQKKSVLETELSLVRAEATELKREMLGLEAVQKEGVTKIRDVLASVSVLDTTLKRKASNAQETAMLIQRNQLQTRLNENEREVGEAKSARESAEAQAKEAQSRIENKDLEIASLKAALADQEIATHRLVEDAQAEITKHLVIENELAMEELRKALKTELNERDAEICRLHEELGTKEEELNKERREKEDLLISVCERSDSVSPSIESRLRHELEGEYRDKLGMLIRGEETKRSKALERAEAEKRAELRLLSEKKDADLAALTASLTALQAQLNHATANRSRHDSLTDTKEGDATLLAAEKAEEPMGPMGLSMSGSVMTLVSPSPDDNADTSAKSPVSQGGEGGGVCREVQTRVSGRSDVVVRVAGEVWEGDGVLVTWSDEFKGFILLTTGSTAYFVKRRSKQSMDFSPMKPLPEGLTLPSPVITKRTRTHSMCERALQGQQGKGKVRYFCRHQGHGFVTPDAGGDDIFVHISDIEGEFVPREGDAVSYRTVTIPPKFNRTQAVHVRILNFAEGVHERWCDPAPPKHDEHCHPVPNTPEGRGDEVVHTPID